MKDKELDREFKEAFKRASETSLRFPPDLMLHFYAYYKRATGDNKSHQLENLDEAQLVGAFKMNALFQVKHLSPDEAKRKYISLVNKYIPK